MFECHEKIPQVATAVEHFRATREDGLCAALTLKIPFAERTQR